MGFSFGNLVKTVATGGLNKVSRPAQSAVKKVSTTVTKVAVAPVTALAKVAPKPIAKVLTASTKPLTTAARVGTSVAVATATPLVAAKSAAGVAGTVNSRVAAAATAMRLPSIAATMNLGKAIKDPKGYVSDIGAGYVGDVSFAGTFYSMVKNKDVKGIVSLGAVDTGKALGALGASSVGNKVASVGLDLAAKLPGPAKNTTTTAQTGGELPLPVPTALGAEPAPLRSSSSKLPLIVAGVGALVVVVLLVRR